MTAQQCAERQAARDNLVQELVEALKFALNEWDGWYDYGRGCGLKEDSPEYRQALALIARAEEQA